MSFPAFISQAIRLPFPGFRSFSRPQRLICCTTSAQPSHLYLVPTPIGNPRDITLRAQDILSTAHVIAAEDTRRTGLLLKTLQRRHDQRLISCHEHNYHARIPTLLQHMEAGSSVALVSDAGTPCVSDPGIQLVTAAVAAGVQVVPLPGACAAISALVASTMPVAKFTFLGFLPRAGEERRTALHHIATSCATVVLYEAPHRLMATLGSLALVEGEGRPVCLARELTKKWEQFLRFHTVASAIEYYQREHVQPKGEFTIVLAPTVVKQPNRDDISAYSQVNVDVAKLVHSLVRDGVPVSTVARCVSTSTNTPKKLIYTYASQCKKELQHYQNHTPG